ncbi:MAG: hypothetical protein WDZ35_01125 [Crocinitomicaceae bacterium]
MKALISLIVAALFGFTLSAQKKAVVYLKNGSAIKGEIVDSTAEGTKIEQKDGSVWFFDKEDIAGIEAYVPKVSRSGMYVLAELGVLGGPTYSPTLHLVNGYQFNRRWMAGLGLGIESLRWGGYIPLYVHGRYNFGEKQATPFIDIMAGYDIPLRILEENKGGFTTGARFGVTKHLSDRLALSTSIGYRYAYLVRVDSWWQDFHSFTHINRFELKVGLLFK